MTIKVGDRVPEAKLLRFGAEGTETVALGPKVKGRKVVVFGLPGAFTRTCTAAHVPSFIRTHDRFIDKGVDEIICIAVNDPFVMKAWGEATGGAAAGITFLGDADASLTKAMGMAFTAPPAGFYDRCKRFAMYIEDGVVKVLHEEQGTGVCETSGGEAMLAAIG